MLEPASVNQRGGLVEAPRGLRDRREGSLDCASMRRECARPAREFVPHRVKGVRCRMSPRQTRDRSWVWRVQDASLRCVCREALLHPGRNRRALVVRVKF